MFFYLMGCFTSTLKEQKSYQVASAIADAIVRAGDPNAIDLDSMCEMRVPHKAYPKWLASQAEAAVALLVERLRNEQHGPDRDAQVTRCLLLIAYICGLREGCCVELEGRNCVGIAPVVSVGKGEGVRRSIGGQCLMRRMSTTVNLVSLSQL